MVFLEGRKFTRKDFAQLHPSGFSGSNLIVTRGGNRFARVQTNQTVREPIVEMTRSKAGSVAIVNSEDELAGIFTDADLRRAILIDSEVFSKPIDALMTKNPITVAERTLVADVLKIFEESKIDDLLVVNQENKPVGIIDGQNLPRLRVV